MQNARAARKAKEIQGYADHIEWKNFFSVIKVIYFPPAKERLRGEQFGTQSSRRRWPSSFAQPATHNLLSKKDRLQKAYIDHLSDADNKAAFYHCRRLVRQQLRDMQNARAARKAMEIQGFADHNEWKKFFSAIYCPPAKRTAPLLSADGNTPLTEKTQIL
ncbi:hypothetical protein SprV_1002888200 [Sparganum proliferum]